MVAPDMGTRKNKELNGCFSHAEMLLETRNLWKPETNVITSFTHCLFTQICQKCDDFSVFCLRVKDFSTFLILFWHFSYADLTWNCSSHNGEFGINYCYDWTVADPLFCSASFMLLSRDFWAFGWGFTYPANAFCLNHFWRKRKDRQMAENNVFVGRTVWDENELISFFSQQQMCLNGFKKHPPSVVFLAPVPQMETMSADSTWRKQLVTTCSGTTGNTST